MKSKGDTSSRNAHPAHHEAVDQGTDRLGVEDLQDEPQHGHRRDHRGDEHGEVLKLNGRRWTRRGRGLTRSYIFVFSTKMGL